MKKITSILMMLLLGLFMVPGAAYAADRTGGTPARVTAEADDDEEDEEEEPTVIPPFTVYLDIADADAVYLTVNDQRIPHTAGVNTVTVDPGDGYIKVHVNEGYAFTRFNDNDAEDQTTASYLQYDYQTMPVTIRISMGTGYGEGVTVDGHSFTIETVDTTTFEQYALTVEVDDASKVDMRVGMGNEVYSSANRKIDLVNGMNTITYTEQDRYVHMTGASFREPLQSVTVDGTELRSDGQINGIYTLRLSGAETAGKHICITALKPQAEENCSVKVIVDDPEMVRWFTKMPSSTDVTLVEGENIVTYAEGEYFDVWTVQEAQEFTFNGEEIEYNGDYRRYQVYPTDGGTLYMRFNDLPRQFTLRIDDPSKVDLFLNDATGDEYELVAGENIIPVDGDDDLFYLYPVEDEALVFTLDGEDVEFDADEWAYIFTPAVGSVVEVRFNEEPEQAAIMLVVDGYELLEGIDVTTSAGRELQVDGMFNEFTLEGESYIRFKASPAPAAVYVNGEALDCGADGYYLAEVEDNSIVRLYLEAEPATVTVTVEADDNAEGKYVILRDLMQSVDGDSNIELAGTYYFIIPNVGDSICVYLAPALSRVRAAETEEGLTEIKMTDGMYRVPVIADTRVIIREAVITAVELNSVNADARFSVYTLGGELVKVNATTADLRNLPAGVYIGSDGRKVMVR